MGARTVTAPAGGNQRGLFETGGESRPLASESAGVRRPVCERPRSESGGSVSQDGATTAAAGGRSGGRCFNPSRDQIEAYKEGLKLSAARDIWRTRHQLTPSGITWEEWFANKFGESLLAYRETKRKEKTV